MLDVDEFIDYMIVHYYGGKQDWSHNNWYATRNRVEAAANGTSMPGTRSTPFPPTTINRWARTPVKTPTRLASTRPRRPTAIHNNLIANEEYRVTIRRPRAEAHAQRRRADAERRGGCLRCPGRRKSIGRSSASRRAGATIACHSRPQSCLQPYRSIQSRRLHRDKERRAERLLPRPHGDCARPIYARWLVHVQRLVDDACRAEFQPVRRRESRPDTCSR